MLYLAEKVKVLNLLASTAIIADTNATGISVEGYEDDALVILQTGIINSTNCAFAVNVQASTALAGTYTTIGSFTALAATDDYKVAAIPVSLKGTDRKYVRVNVDTTLAAGASLVEGNIGAVLLARPTVAASGINSATAA